MRTGIANNSCQNRRSAALSMLASFEHERGRTFAIYQTVATGVKGSAGPLWFVVAVRQIAVAPVGEQRWVNSSSHGPSNHHVGRATLDRSDRLDDCAQTAHVAVPDRVARPT